MTQKNPLSEIIPYFETVPERLLNAGLLALAVTFVASMLIPTWRMRPQLPIAGFVLGLLAGWATSAAGGDGLGPVIATLIGTVVGPNLVIFLSGENVSDVLGELILKLTKAKLNAAAEAITENQPDDQDREQG